MSDTYMHTHIYISSYRNGDLLTYPKLIEITSITMVILVTNLPPYFYIAIFILLVLLAYSFLYNLLDYYVLNHQ